MKGVFQNVLLLLSLAIIVGVKAIAFVKASHAFIHTYHSLNKVSTQNNSSEETLFIADTSHSFNQLGFIKEENFSETTLKESEEYEEEANETLLFHKVLAFLFAKFNFSFSFAKVISPIVCTTPLYILHCIFRI